VLIEILAEGGDEGVKAVAGFLSDRDSHSLLIQKTITWN
jgi:hypothetical protein